MYRILDLTQIFLVQIFYYEYDVYVYTNISAHTHTHTHPPTHAHTHPHTHTHSHTHTDTHPHTHTHTPTHTHPPTHAHRDDNNTGRSVSSPDIQYEQACILYNIACLHTLLGCADDRTEPEVRVVFV